MKISNRTGDDGTTSLFGGKRVPKYDLRIEAYGSIDELIAWIGLLRDFRENKNRTGFLIYIQDKLMKCAASLATEQDNKNIEKFLPGAECITALENEIERIEAKLPETSHFILPGGHVLVSYCHIARCVCRRVERTVLRLSNAEKIPQIVPIFLNRLSDYLFVLSRLISLELDIQEITWH